MAVLPTSHPDSEWCGTREAAALAHVGYQRLLHLRKQHPDLFGTIAYPTPGSGQSLDWHKDRLRAAMEQLRIEGAPGGEAA